MSVCSSADLAHPHTPSQPNFDCIIIKMLQALGLLSVWMENSSAGLVCHWPRTQGSTMRKKKSRRRYRNVSCLKVSLHVQLPGSSVILAIVHSSLKAHQSENRVSYFHWPLLCFMWPAHTACVWVASKSCWTAALLLVPQSTKFIISLSSNSLVPGASYTNAFLIGKSDTYS